jgi:DNA polymerase-3 subunit gamma/tau
MENFIVSARKYRPATFHTVVGQASITNTLKNSIRNNHLAQAFLFCGPRGVGKTTCARILAKTINCFNVTSETEACNECESCRSFNENHSFNIHELDAASNNSVDDIRALVDQVRFAPQVGQYSIYIIDEVHMLSSAAFNAFLKTLEEPPKHAIFILATTEKHKILPTILSRCQVFTFSRIKVDDIANHLAFVAKSENIEADTEALHIIAQKADGALRDALSMFDQIVSYSGDSKIEYEHAIENLNVLDYDYFFNVVEAVLKSSYADVLLIYDSILSKGFDGGNFIAGLGDHLRNLLVCKDAATLNLLEVSASLASKYQTQAQQLSPLYLVLMLELINKFDVQYKSSRNPRLTAELMLLQLCKMINDWEEKKNLKSAPINAPASAQDHKSETKTASSSLSTMPASTESKTLNEPDKKTVYGFKNNPVIQRIPKITISQALEKSAKKNDEPAEIVQEKLVQQELPAKEFSKELLTKKWKLYAEKCKLENRGTIFGNMTHTTPELGKDFEIRFELHNQSQLLEMDREKMNILEFLRAELENYKINLHFHIVEQEKNDLRPFTTDQKIQTLEEQFPAFKMLKDKLGLKPF